MAPTSQSPEVRAVRETILGQRAASGLSGRLVTMLQRGYIQYAYYLLYDIIADNDKPGDYKVDMPEASLFACP